jgi:CheY-like chemotaxis protein
LLARVNETPDRTKTETGKPQIETHDCEPDPRTDPAKHRFRVNKFLIVADNPMSLRALREQLEQLGFACLAASSGEQALEILEHQRSDPPVDAVLIDWKLPGIDGIETARKIRAMENGSDVSIVIIGADGQELDNRTYHKVRLNGFLHQPIRRSAVFETLIDLFSERRHSPSIRPESFEAGGKLSGASRGPAENNSPPFEPIAGFDLREGVERFGNKPELYTKLLKAFVETTTNTGNQIRNQISTGNLKGAYLLLHTLQGIAGNLSATRLLAATLELEATTRARTDGNPISTEVEQQSLDHFLEALESTLEDAKRRLPLGEPSIPGTADSWDKDLSEQSAKETARRIRDATFMGDLSELQSIAEGLPADSYWAIEVFRLTDNLDFDGLEKLAYALDNLY